VIEVAPVPDSVRARRGVVAGGPVGARIAGALRLFRYEVRCWYGGAIPDIDEAVESPVRLTDDPETAHRLLELTSQVPTPVWGRDELGTGDMWNSNSVVAWLIAQAGLAVHDVRLPSNGRAPGWNAGVVVGQREPWAAAYSSATDLGTQKAQASSTRSLISSSSIAARSTCTQW